MTNEQRKEDLRKLFLDLYLEDFRNQEFALLIFDFFFSEIESGYKEIKYLQTSEDELCLKVKKEQDEAVRVYNQGEERDKIRLAELQRLEEIIEARDKRAELYEYEVEALKRVVREYEAERRHLEEIIKAADEVIFALFQYDRSPNLKNEKKVSVASEHYNKLKSKLPSGI